MDLAVMGIVLATKRVAHFLSQHVAKRAASLVSVAWMQRARPVR